MSTSHWRQPSVLNVQRLGMALDVHHGPLELHGSPVDAGASIDIGAPLAALAALDRYGDIAHSSLTLATLRSRSPLPSMVTHEVV